MSPKHFYRDDAIERIEQLEAALRSVEAWLDRWAAHVGNCRGGNLCECGLTRVRFDARAALKETTDDRD